MLEPYDGKLSRTVLRRESGGNTADPADYSPLVNRLKGQVIKISPNSTQFINPMDINANYSEEDNPLSLKADFILSLCELVVGGKEGLLPVEKTVIDRCVHVVYRKYFENPTPENMPLLEDLYNALLTQDEPEARHVAAALEIYVKGSLNIFNHHTNVDINNRIVCFDIKQLGKQLKKLGMLIVQDAVWGRVTANRSAGKSTRYYADEFHLLLKEEQTAAYSVEIWKRFRKWGGIPTALTQNVKDLLASPEVSNIFENSDFVYMTYDEKKTAGERLILACMELPNTEEQVVGSYRGFELSLRFDTFHNEHQALLKGTLKYPVPLGSDPHGNIVRLDNALSNFADRSTAAENELDTLRQQQAAAQVEVAKPFPQEEELAQKSARLAELNAQLDVDEKHHEPEQDEEEKEDAPRRSVLAVLEEKAEKAEPVKPFKSYLDKDGDAR